MARKLDEQTAKLIAAFLDGKPNLPANIAVELLRKIDIHVSNNTVNSIRKRFKMPYEQDKRVFNVVQLAKNKGIDVTDEYLRLKCPQICAEHREYLVQENRTKVRRELPPFKVGGIAHVVHQIMAVA